MARTDSRWLHETSGLFVKNQLAGLCQTEPIDFAAVMNGDFAAVAEQIGRVQGDVAAGMGGRRFLGASIVVVGGIRHGIVGAQAKFRAGIMVAREDLLVEEYMKLRLSVNHDGG